MKREGWIGQENGRERQNENHLRNNYCGNGRCLMSAWSDFQEVLAQGDGDGFCAVRGVDLREDSIDVRFNAAFSDSPSRIPHLSVRSI